MPRPVPDPQQESLIEAIRRAVAANGDARHALTGNLVATVAAIIRAFTGWYDDLAVQRLAKQVADLVTPTQRVMASQEDAYLSQVASTMSGRIVRPVGPVDVSDLRVGVPADQVYARLAEQYRWERSVGTGEDDALAKVLTRAGVMNTTDVALAARSQAQSFFEEHKVTGYRRVLHPELSKGGSCGLCIAASDRIYHRDQLLPLHARCACGVMPIIGSFDAGNSLNNLDLADLYDAAGSTSAADLKKTRWQVNAHGELGPVLAPKGAEDRLAA